ncbi:PilN domain-containing protein, partial [Thermodesulfovibrionales bacterium]|nr:PilN domain-containing protein [Thermodesulfovibrionales bacterium]
KRERLDGEIATLRELESQLRETQRKRYYLEEVLPVQRKVLLELFEGLIRGIPCEVVLKRISQEEINIFFLEGSGFSLSSIMAWTRDLGHLEIVQETRLETISKKRAEEADLFRYQFRVRVVLN